MAAADRITHTPRTFRTHPVRTGESPLIPAKDFKKRMVVDLDGAPHMIEQILVQTPSARGAATLYKIKGGDLSEEVTREMAAYAEELRKAGAEVLIAGCTEAPLVLDSGDVRLELIDPGDLLARRCVAVCLGREPAPHVPA